MPIIHRVMAACLVPGMAMLIAWGPTAAASVLPGDPFLVTTWSTEEGLPQSSVIALTQTRDGYLWMGTLNGLVRFDGANFTVFDESNTPGLPTSRVVHVFEDSHTNLWVGTETAGLILVRGGQAVSLDVGRGSRDGRVVSATEDERGTVWLYTADGQLCRYMSGRMDVWPVGAQYYSPVRNVISEAGGRVWAGMVTNQFGLSSESGDQVSKLPLAVNLPARELDFLLASRDGGYWRLADGRVEKWNGTQKIQDHGEYPWGQALITAACEDLDGRLIIGTLTSGVYWYDDPDRPTRVPRLSSDNILSLCVDREGDLWVGTDGGGLNRVKRSSFQVLPGTEDWVVQSVSSDAEGGLWIGCNGGELAHWIGGELKSYRTTLESVPPSVKSVAVDRESRVWVGTWGRGLFRLQNDRFLPEPVAGLPQSAVVAILQDRMGNLWLGMQEGLARLGGPLFTVRDGLSQNAVRAIAEDPDGSLWVGTAGGGLNHFRNNAAFVAYRKSSGQLPSDDITALHFDPDGGLWIATAGGGLTRLRDGQWETISKQDGLPGNSVGYLLEDAEGFLWLGSNVGLLRIRKSDLDAHFSGHTNTLFFRAYGKADGLPTRECTFGSQPAACVTPDGRLWFPTINGVVSVDPAGLVPNPLPPPVAIESIRIDNSEQGNNLLNRSWPRHVTLVPGNQLLEVTYTGLNLSARERTRFRYRLSGHDPGWVEAGSDRVARYPQLPPGHYVFQVTAANEDGVWNPTPASLEVTVLPPFWRTWWFLAGMAALLIVLIAGSAYYMATQRLQRQVALLRQQEALEKERARIARDLHDQLGANLTQVSLLGELVETDKDLPDEVEAHARQICDTARETTRNLDEIVWAANPSNDTLESLVNYVCKYAQDYLALAGLRYRLDVPSPLPAVTLKPELRHNIFLAAKEAVNNVVKHAQASEARVSLTLEPDAFVLEIADNGRGPGGTETRAARTRNGLRNMRKRMQDIGGSFLMDRAPGGGSLVRLSVPFKKV